MHTSLHDTETIKQLPWHICMMPTWFLMLIPKGPTSFVLKDTWSQTNKKNRWASQDTHKAACNVKNLYYFTWADKPASVFVIRSC